VTEKCIERNVTVELAWRDIKLAFMHDADTDFLARILADTSDTRVLITRH